MADIVEWISVRDYLPEEGKVVLVYDANEWCEQAVSMWREGSSNVGYYTGEHWMAGGHESNPTHWMPLPTPPAAAGETVPVPVSRIWETPRRSVPVARACESLCGDTPVTEPMTKEKRAEVSVTLTDAERGRTNHDAAPAARAAEPESSVPLGSVAAPANTRTLTDEEREAVGRQAKWLVNQAKNKPDIHSADLLLQEAATLRGLLERMGGGG